MQSLKYTRRRNAGCRQVRQIRRRKNRRPTFCRRHPREAIVLHIISGISHVVNIACCNRDILRHKCANCDEFIAH